MKIERGDVTNAVLATIKIAGLITIAALAPNVVQQLGNSLKGKRLANTKYYVKTIVGKLEKQGLIEFENNGNTRHIVLSEKGERKLAIHQELSLDKRLSREWDGKWRIVIFDIKECTRSSRDTLRN
ncbi:MAG: hypothetical protein HZA94_01905 [Candidatus Vogelbacteria bacterium]|nr:hypothetical protein [Candidatus Vogelbacteria bacterium]